MPELGRDAASRRVLWELRGLWTVLQPYLAEERCRACECLLGALTELRLALEEIPPDDDREELLTAVRGALAGSPPHGCLGCMPCPPADILAGFYRAQQAAAQVGWCACGGPCADGPVHPSTPGG